MFNTHAFGHFSVIDVEVTKYKLLIIILPLDNVYGYYNTSSICWFAKWSQERMKTKKPNGE